MSDYTKTDIGAGYNSTQAINSETSKIEVAVNSKVDESGGVMSGSLDMNSNRILNLPDASGLQEPVTYNQLINGASFAAADAKFYDTVTLATSDTSLMVGDVVIIKERASGIFDTVTAGTTANVNLPNTYNIIVSTVDPTICFVLREEAEMDVAHYGAVIGADSTLAVQAAFDRGIDITVSENYIIDPVDTNAPTTKYGGGVKPSDNTIITFRKGGKFTALTTAAGEYVVVNLNGVTNVKIIDGLVIGDVGSHTGGTGEFGFGYYCTSNTDVALIRCRADLFWGDGFYVGGGEGTVTTMPKNTLLEDCIAEDNRRQGLSIVGCERLRVIGGEYRKTGLTAETSPAFGIDIEPDPSGQTSIDCDLIGVTTSDNAKGGLQLVPGFMSNAAYTTRNYRVRVVDYTSRRDGSSGALRCAFPSLTDANIDLTNVIYGEIIVQGARIVEPTQRGVDFARWIETAPYVRMENVSVIDCNTDGGSATTAEQCAFVVEALSADSTEQTSTGKIDFINPRAIDTRAVPLMLLPMYLNAQSALQSIDNVNVLDAIGEGFTSATNGHVSINSTTNAKVTYTGVKPVKTFTGNVTLVSGQFTGYEITASSSAVVTLPLSATSKGLVYIFKGTDGVTLQVSPNAADTIDTMGITTGNDAILRDATSYLVIESLGGTTWRTVSFSGNTHPQNYGQGGLPNFAFLTGSGTPVSNVTPDHINTIYFDGATNAWISNGTTNTSWLQIN